MCMLCSVHTYFKSVPRTSGHSLGQNYVNTMYFHMSCESSNTIRESFCVSVCLHEKNETEISYFLSSCADDICHREHL